MVSFAGRIRGAAYRLYARRMLDRPPEFDGTTPVFYMNRTAYSMLRIQALNKTLGTTLLLSRATREALRQPLALHALPVQCIEGIERPLETFTPDYG